MAGKKVVVNVPRLRKEEADLFLSVNGKNIVIQRGKDVEIPEEFAEVLKHSQRADDIAIRYIMDLETESKE